MRQWRTIALDRDGRTLRSRIAAPDEASVARHLRDAGTVPLEIKPDRQALFGFGTGRLSGGGRPFQLRGLSGRPFQLRGLSSGRPFQLC